MVALPTDAQMLEFVDAFRARRLRARRDAAAERRHNLRILLWVLLGAPEYCAGCGMIPDDLLTLEPDHAQGREYEPREIASETRIKIYCLEIVDGAAVRPLCRACNASGNGRVLPWRDAA